jgi:hypothetical protein
MGNAKICQQVYFETLAVKCIISYGIIIIVILLRQNF